MGEAVDVDLELHLLHEGVEVGRQRPSLEAGVEDLLEVKAQAAARGPGPVQARERVAHVAEDEGAAAHRRASMRGRDSKSPPCAIPIESFISPVFGAGNSLEASGVLP